MGNSAPSAITKVIDIAVLAHSITVKATLDDRSGTDFTGRLHCAAFPYPTWAGDGFNWGQFQTVSVHAEDRDATYTMPPITIDAHGAPIKELTRYRVRCGVDITGTRDHSYEGTDVRTPEKPYVCETGVKVNGMEAPRVMLNKQSSLTLSGLDWTKFPPSMDGMHAFEVPHPVQPMSEITLKCCAGEECEFFFALYNCEACTGPKPAGLAQTLLLEGFDAGACSPQFGDGYRTTAFHKSVDAVDGEVELTFQVPHKEVMSVYGMPGAVAKPWCVKPHGPSAPTFGCGVRCPTL